MVRYELRAYGGVNPVTGARQQIKRRFATERAARAASAEIGQQAQTGTFTSRKAITVDELCADWPAPLHNTRELTCVHYGYVLDPLREQFGGLAVQKLTRARYGVPGRRSLNVSVDAWRLVLEYGCERGELVHNVASAMRKVPRAGVK